MSKLIYTGIGSRETPNSILKVMELIACFLETQNYILRSGGADGADTAFANGCELANQEIYVPWKNFNKVPNGIDDGNIDEGMELASSVHPAWHRCSIGAKKLHSRNTFQIFGNAPLSNPIPTRFVVCYTKQGQLVGGTSTALKLAMDANIPIFNLGTFETKYPNDNEDVYVQKLYFDFTVWYKELFC